MIFIFAQETRTYPLLDLAQVTAEGVGASCGVFVQGKECTSYVLKQLD